MKNELEWKKKNKWRPELIKQIGKLNTSGNENNFFFFFMEELAGGQDGSGAWEC